MKKRRVLAAIMTATLALSLAGCGGSSGDSKSSGSSDSSVANADKPLCWFNRQPSNSSTGELDKEALNFNDDTYYVGFDANQGAELQGQMVVDYIKANADKIDRNGDGVIGYVLAIGDIGHMILSLVHVVFVLLLEQVLMQTVKLILHQQELT